MKKIKKTFLSLGVVSLFALPIITTISCSSGSSNYKVMDFKISNEKCAQIANNEQDLKNFNNESISVAKLAKITMQSENNLDRYVKEAIDLGLFQQIAIEGKKVIIKMTNKKEVNNKTIYYSYRLPNGNLSFEHSF